ncbi:TonB-dependent receptor plug domain-containing protein [Spirosoma sp. KUDC1026]|uniref:TonB-dependent receptor plug domain-containing protein n=1 Tax=Spirosoma sp. KUDC1026 TaxID=2745947 RepID=UPI00159BBADC|nr:TonB-dependent receptor [Spirosoma sp. KUDC1026]QKZ12166.1 TonB-dependent receptor [Spirosoma sp. KUDC1026]
MLSLYALSCLIAFQQADSTGQRADSLKGRALNEVVVTATRTERPMGSLPMPVTVINKAQIQQMGSLRLNDVLREQTGLALVTDHGQGIQVQGFGPEYTMILLDGEPLVGRTAGTLDLTRLAVGNIKQIEIVKGPSSSLYGSEALAGVVNIITDNANRTMASLSARYGANRTSDLTGDVSLKSGKIGLYAFANRYQSAGYDLTPETVGQTVSPFLNHTFSGRLTADLSSKLKLSVSGRYFTENQNNRYDVTNDIITGLGKVLDWNFNPVLTHRPSDRWKITYRYYRTGYRTDSDLRYQRTGEGYDQSYFQQTFNRPEIQVDRYIGQKQILTLGTGYLAESVNATRYTELKRFNDKYVYFQYEWLPTSRWDVIVGGRYDAHSQYASQFSPKLSARYELSQTLALRGSVGVGFKAPDFRQLYLNFDNGVVGYSVFGTQELVNSLARLQQAGQIAEVLADPARFSNIRAESSLAYNLGLVANLDRKYSLPVTFSLNLFRNNIRDLIETQAVALKTNGQSVFSYLNLSRVVTQGAELEGQYRLNVGSGKLTISGGYQYLQALDQSVLDQIKAGTLYKRDPSTLITTLVKRSDYGGLYNRSRHMANVKVFYELPKQGLSANLRGIYRGRYGFADRNGNVVLDADNEYVQGYMLWNAAVSKRMNAVLLQLGVDNLLSHTDPQYIPNLAGRLWYASLRWTLQTKS